MDDGGAGGAGDAVVVGLAQAADGRDAGLGQEVHGQVAEALLRDDQIRLVLDDLGALPLYVVLLQLQQRRPAASPRLYESNSYQASPMLHYSALSANLCFSPDLCGFIRARSSKRLAHQPPCHLCLCRLYGFWSHAVLTVGTIPCWQQYMHSSECINRLCAAAMLAGERTSPPPW